MCLCTLWYPWKRCTVGFMTHPASAGKESETALRQWESVSYTERRSFREERERRGEKEKKDHDRQRVKHSHKTVVRYYKEPYVTCYEESSIIS